jgi:hypothetical protein
MFSEVLVPSSRQAKDVRATAQQFRIGWAARIGWPSNGNSATMQRETTEERYFLWRAKRLRTRYGHRRFASYFCRRKIPLSL